MFARAQHDPSALREILADDIEWDVGAIQTIGDAREWQGADGVMEFFRQWVGAFTDWGYEVDEIFAHGDSVIAELRQWGTGKGSGLRVEQRWWQVWTIRDGKAVRGSNHDTREEALAAAEA